MVAIIMPSTTSIINKLQKDYPDISFKLSDRCYWSYNEKTIFYSNDPIEDLDVIHELAHALLEHKDYIYDIDLINMERDAWQKAKELADFYSVIVNDDLIQDDLDTYRRWLHLRSKCPNCQLSGIQTSKNCYKCLNCSTKWTVNEAKDCQLKRHQLKTR